MVVEHTFVTTMEGPQALQTAMAFLRSRGFEGAVGSGFQVQAPFATIPPPPGQSMRGQPMASPSMTAGSMTEGSMTAPQWNSLEMTRGRKNAARAKNIVELPQVVRVDYDRGRVNVAANITPNMAWGGGTSSDLAPVLMFGALGYLLMRSGTSGIAKKMVVHQQILTGLVTGLEGVLARGQTIEQASADVIQAERKAIDMARRRNRRNWIILGVVVSLMLGLMILVLVAAAYRW